MQRNSRQSRGKENNLVPFTLTSWLRGRPTCDHFKLKKTDKVFDLLQHIADMARFKYLYAEFMVKAVYSKDTTQQQVNGKTYRVGGLNYPIDMQLQDFQSGTVKGNATVELRLITPDKYQSRTYNDNPLYTVAFLISFGTEPPKNLHGNCILNNERLGYHHHRGSQESDGTLDNRYDKLIVIKTSKGKYLVNIYCLLNCVSGAGRIDIKPHENFDAIIKIDGINYKIPKRGNLVDNLVRFIESGESTLEYVVDMYKHESFLKKIKIF